MGNFRGCVRGCLSVCVSLSFILFGLPIHHGDYQQNKALKNMFVCKAGSNLGVKE